MISIKKLHSRANTRPQEPSWGRATMEPSYQPAGNTARVRKPTVGNYDPFQDPNLAVHMRKPNVKQHLVQAGLMNKDGTHLPTREEKIQLDRTARLDMQSYQRCQNVYRRMNKRLERMKADLDANKRLFNPEAALSCQYCGCTKLTEVNATFSNDGSRVKCLACSRTSKPGEPSRKSIVNASLAVPRLPALRPRPLAALPQTFGPLKAKPPLRAPLRPKRMPLQTTRQEAPGYISSKYESAAAETIVAPPPSPFPDCNADSKPTPTLSSMIDEKLEELLQAEEKCLKEMYEKVVKREEDLDSKEDTQQPLQNPKQQEMIAGKEDQLHVCCKRYMTLTTAVDTIEAMSSEQLNSPKTSRSTLHSFPIPLKERDMREIDDIEKVVRQEMQVSKVHLTERAAKKDEKKAFFTSTVALTAPCSVAANKVSQPKLISMDFPGDVDNSTIPDTLPRSTQPEPCDKDDIQQFPDMSPATPAPTRSATPALPSPSRPATPAESTAAEQTSPDVFQMRPILLAPVRPAGPWPNLPSIRRASKPKFPSKPKFSSKLSPIRVKPDGNCDEIQCTGTNALTSHTAKPHLPLPSDRTSKQKLTPLNLPGGKYSTVNSKKRLQELSAKFTPRPGDMKPPLIITPTGPRPTLPSIKKTPRSQSKLITLKFPINTPSSPLDCRGVPAGIHTSGPLRGLRPVTRRTSLPNTLYNDDTTDDVSQRKSVSTEPEKHVSQGAEGDKVVPDDEAVDSGDTDASGENQQISDAGTSEQVITTGEQEAVVDSSSVSPQDAPDVSLPLNATKDEVETVEENKKNETFDGPDMSVKDKDNESTPTPQVTGQAASNNVADCTSPEQGRVLKTEQDDTPKDQSLQKVEEEPNSGFEQDKEPVPLLPITDGDRTALENQQHGLLQRSYSQELNAVAVHVATSAIMAAADDDC